MGCYFLLQGIFQTQGSNPGLLQAVLVHCRWILCRLSQKMFNVEPLIPPPQTFISSFLSLTQPCKYLRCPHSTGPKSERRTPSLFLLSIHPIYYQVLLQSMYPEPLVSINAIASHLTWSP